jgi:Skp family chaperone for outer membrane proteins
MRGKTEINAEIAALQQALKSRRWNTSARETIVQSIEVLFKRMTEAQVEQAYYVDETASDYTEGDNDLYHELVRVCQWLHGAAGSKAPSETL